MFAVDPPHERVDLRQTVLAHPNRGALVALFPHARFVAGATVSLAAGAGNSEISASGVTDTLGVYTFTVTDTTVENVTYTATAGGTELSDDDVTVTFRAQSVDTDDGEGGEGNTTVEASPTLHPHTSSRSVSRLIVRPGRRMR